MRKENRKAGIRLRTGINRVLSAIFAASLLTSAWYVNPTGAAGNYGAVKVYAEETDETGLPVSEETVPEEGVSGDSIFMDSGADASKEEGDLTDNNAVMWEEVAEYAASAWTDASGVNWNYSILKYKEHEGAIVCEGSEGYADYAEAEQEGICIEEGSYEDIISLEIPSEIEGRKVVAIGGLAFDGCSGLESISVPDSITRIGYEAFYGCSGLKSISIPSSVTSIEYKAFYGCSGLKSISIPSSVTSIGYEAFYGCSGLTSISIPDSVTSIGREVFGGCSGLTSISIPSGVTSIDNGAFEGCSGLESITVDNGNSIYKSEGNAIIEKATNTLILGCKNTDIPSSVTSIGGGAFSGCSDMASISIPSSVTSIGDCAFEDCSGLTSVTIPNSVTSIGGGAFSGCNGLTSIDIPSSVTSIGSSAFSGCNGLESITVDNGNSIYKSEGNAIIKQATNTLILGCKTTSIPSSVTSIGQGAFRGCSGLTSINIPSGVTSIAEYAFYGCSGLESINIPSSVTSIGAVAFHGCSGLTSVSIPNSVTSIGISAFSGCSGLESINIPSSVTRIGQGAFRGCSGLTSINIPSGVTVIGDEVFYGCSSLTSINIPSGVTKIGEDAFSGCSRLADVYYSGSKSDWDKININYYNENLLNADIHYEKTDSEQSEEDNPKQPVTPAPTDNKAPVTNKTSVKAENDSQVTTTDKGTAALTMAAPSGKKTVSVPSTVTVDGVTYDVTEVGANAFKDLKKTTTVILPKTVKKIKANAFTTSKIKTVKLTVSKGQKLTIDKKAFKNSKVQKVQLTVSKKATEKEIKALKKALKKAGIKENNIKISKKLK